MRGESPNLDLFRAVAVSMVFIDHTVGYFLNGQWGRVQMGLFGGLGVAFFFVHTSLVLMMSMERSRLRGWALASTFYVRRAFRIYPLSCVLVLFVFFTGIPLRFLTAHVATGAPLTPVVLFTNLTLTQNLSGQPNLSGQLWSLPIELDMYVLLPLIFLLTMKYPRAFRWLAWPAAAGFALLLRYIPHGHEPASVLRFAPLFIAGVLAFNLSKVVKPRLEPWLWPVAIGSAMTIFMIFRIWEVGWVLCLLLGCSLVFIREQKNRVLNRITHVVAKYSYGIYLTHLLTIWLAFVYLVNLPMFARVIVFVVSSTALPYILFHAIERPGIELGKRIVERSGNRENVTGSVALGEGCRP